MISATQREALAVLAELCEWSTDIRLGQLLAHLGFLGEDQTGRSLWNIDDEEFLTVLYHHRAELAARRLSTAEEGIPRLIADATSPNLESVSHEQGAAGASAIR